jgi:hypothetical protein
MGAVAGKCVALAIGPLAIGMWSGFEVDMPEA